MAFVGWYRWADSLCQGSQTMPASQRSACKIVNSIFKRNKNKKLKIWPKYIGNTRNRSTTALDGITWHQSNVRTRLSWGRLMLMDWSQVWLVCNCRKTSHTPCHTHTLKRETKENEPRKEKKSKQKKRPKPNKLYDQSLPRFGCKTHLFRVRKKIMCWLPGLDNTNRNEKYPNSR